MEYIPEDEMLLEEEELQYRLDPRRYYRLFLKRKWIILSIFLSITVLTGIGLLFWSPQPVYRAEVTLRVDEGIDQSRFAIISSRSFAEVVVEELALNINVNTVGYDRNDIFAYLKTTRSPIPGNYLIKLSDDNYELILDEDEFLASGPVEDIELDIKKLDGLSFRINPEMDSEIQEIQGKVAELGYKLFKLHGRSIDSKETLFRSIAKEIMFPHDLEGYCIVRDNLVK